MRTSADLVQFAELLNTHQILSERPDAVTRNGLQVGLVDMFDRVVDPLVPLVAPLLTPLPPLMDMAHLRLLVLLLLHQRHNL